MITRPRTDDLIGDCCRELIEHIMPALSEETLRVRLAMTETVLRNAAVRAAHEIAWMREETEQLCEFARAVAARHPSPAIATALEVVDHSSSANLHLDGVVDTYEAAGRAFEAALEIAAATGAADLVAAARELLRARIDTEKRVMATYVVVGR